MSVLNKIRDYAAIEFLNAVVRTALFGCATLEERYLKLYGEPLPEASVPPTSDYEPPMSPIPTIKAEPLEEDIAPLSVEMPDDSNVVYATNNLGLTSDAIAMRAQQLRR